MARLRRLLAKVGVRTPFGRDAVLAGVLVLAGAASTLGAAPVLAGDPAPSPVLAAFGAAATAVPVAWRRRAPVATLAAVTLLYLAHLAAFAAHDAFNAGYNAPLFVALYSVGAYTERRRTLLAAGPAVLLAVVAELTLLTDATMAAITVEGPSAQLVYAGVLIGGVVYAATVLLGAYVQTRRAYRAELVARAERLERERTERAERAVADERARLARELHDVVAHHLSGMVVQAGAAERLLERDPAQARALLADLRASGRSTLASMRRLVGVLRADAEEGTAPQPGLERLDVVLEQARAAGVAAELTVEGERRPLRAEVDLAAYRVLQEALTNVRKHAPGATARVAVRYRDDDVEVEVADDGAATAPVEEEPSSGVGLVGLRERAAILGGELKAGPNARGGWTVVARIPLEAEVAG